MNEHLSEVQKLILDVFGPVHQYMEKHHLEYYMLGGTLLGAIRHKGFIPWDDDIDIGMPRKQYEYFLKNIEKELPPHLKLHTYYNEQSHHYYFARVVDTRYSMKRTGSLEERAENVWIDIFPLDGMPRNKLAFKFHQLRLLWIKFLYHCSCFERVNLKRPGRPLHERVLIAFVKKTGFGKNLSTRKMLRRLDKALKKYPYEKSDYVVNFMGQYTFREMFPKSYYQKGTLYPFEQYELRGPVEYDLVLTQMYGDYMTPPKEQDRNAHAAELEEQSE